MRVNEKAIHAYDYGMQCRIKPHIQKEKKNV